MEGIVDVRQPGVGTRRGLIDLDGTFHIQSFVRVLVVEDLNELGSGPAVARSWRPPAWGFFLQGEMHAPVTTIFFASTFDMIFSKRLV